MLIPFLISYAYLARFLCEESLFYVDITTNIRCQEIEPLSFSLFEDEAEQT
jgi:hypothetical protein